MTKAALIKMMLITGVLALLGLVYWQHRRSLIEEGYQKAYSEIREAESQAQREANREIARLLELNYDVTEQRSREMADIQAVVDRLSEHERWLREQNRSLTDRLARSDSQTVRAYAEAVSRNNERLREHVVRFGREAAECSATAYSLKEYQDAVLEKGLPSPATNVTTESH